MRALTTELAFASRGCAHTLLMCCAQHRIWQWLLVDISPCAQHWLACPQANGIDAARLASYDRAIRDEPSFKPEQVEGLTRDLTAYLSTLKVRRKHSDPRDFGSPPGNVLVARSSYLCCRA